MATREIPSLSVCREKVPNVIQYFLHEAINARIDLRVRLLLVHFVRDIKHALLKAVHKLQEDSLLLGHVGPGKMHKSQWF